MNEQELKEEIQRLRKWNRWFFGRVQYMRECQKEYFKLRTVESLHKSKALEQEVDAEIRRIEQLKAQQLQGTIPGFDPETEKK